MTKVGKGPRGLILSPAKGDYPMNVRKICVTPGQKVREGDCIAELLEPSGRWVSLVVASCNTQIKAIRAREGDVLDSATALCEVKPERRPATLEGTTLSVVSRISLDELLTREASELAHAAVSATVRLYGRRHDDLKIEAPPENGAGLQLLKPVMATLAGLVFVAGAAMLGSKMYEGMMQQPEVTMDTLWNEMRASRIAAAEAFNSDVNDDVSLRAASQRRADSAAQDFGSKSTACNGFFIGQELPGVHMTRGVRKVTYLDPSRGVGAFIWSKSQASESFACAAVKRR